jgi:hypothetical protein
LNVRPNETQEEQMIEQPMSKVECNADIGYNRRKAKESRKHK